MINNNKLQIARWSFWAGVTFIAILAALHLIKSHVDPAWNFISEYQVGRMGWLMSVAFVSLALSCILLSIVLWSLVHVVGKIGIVMLLISSAGMLIAAVFKTDPLNTDPNLVTTSGKLHQLGAMLDQIPFAAVLLTISLFRKSELSGRRWILIFLLIFVWFGFVYFVASVQINFPENGKFGPHVLVGWQNRLMIVTQVLWLIIVAKETTRIREKSGVNASLTTQQKRIKLTS
jgi:hypothetical protein